jgi:hypothetical protein
MPFSIGARSCPGMKIGFSVAEVLLREMTANIDVFVPQNYIHTRSLRSGAKFYVRKMTEQSYDITLQSMAFLHQVQKPRDAQKLMLQLRDFSVNFELACSQLLPKGLVVSFNHQSKFKSLFFFSFRLVLIFSILQLIALYTFPKDIV